MKTPMTKNPLALLGVASIALLLAACGGGGSDAVVDTAAIPASFNGTWSYTEPCSATFERSDSAGGGQYYGGPGVLTVDSTAGTATAKDLVYEDAQCTIKAGAVTYRYSFTEVTAATLSGYTDARTGVSTETGVTMSADGNGTGLSLKYPQFGNGERNSFVAGLKNSTTFCLDSATIGTTPDIAQGSCYVRP